MRRREKRKGESGAGGRNLLLGVALPLCSILVQRPPIFPPLSNSIDTMKRKCVRTFSMRRNWRRT